MSRRFLLGTPKGQNTTADTFFNTLRETFYLVPTSAETTFGTTFLTPIELQPTGYYSNRPIYITSQLTAKTTLFLTPYLTYYDTTFPTGYVFPTLKITEYNTPYVTTRPTSAPTDYAVITAYVTTFGTTYSQNTNTSFITNYTYPVTTTYPTAYPVFVTTTYGTSRPTGVTEPVYQSTIYSNPTTYPGFTTPTAYPTSNPTTVPTSFSGCFYYDVNGNQTGSDPLPPAGCVNPAPCPFVDTTGTASVYTYFNTTRSTEGTTTFLTHVYVGQSTFSIFYTPGLTDPENGIFGCYDAYDPDVNAYCLGAGTCQGCDYFNSTTFDTDVGYDTYTTAPATVITTFETSALTSVSYLSSRCFPPCAYNCTVTTSYFTYVPTFYSPSTVVTSYPINTFIRNTTYSIITYFNTSNETFTGNFTPVNTSHVTQYPTSNVTSRSTTTSFIVNTTNPYNVPTAYLTSTSFITSFPTDYVTSNSTATTTNTSMATTRETNHPTEVLTARSTDSETLWFEVETTVSTSRMTDILTTYPQNTEVLTSRSTTWFTQ
jgi:hypothetical protein